MELRARGSRFALPPCGTANPFCVSITLGQRLGDARIAAPERGEVLLRIKNLLETRFLLETLPPRIRRLRHARRRPRMCHRGRWRGDAERASASQRLSDHDDLRRGQLEDLAGGDRPDRRVLPTKPIDAGIRG